eukprot:737878-Amphidinium_carterae.3
MGSAKGKFNSRREWHFRYADTCQHFCGGCERAPWPQLHPSLAGCSRSRGSCSSRSGGLVALPASVIARRRRVTRRYKPIRRWFLTVLPLFAACLVASTSCSDEDPPSETLSPPDHFASSAMMPALGRDRSLTVPSVAFAYRRFLTASPCPLFRAFRRLDVCLPMLRLCPRLAHRIRGLSLQLGVCMPSLKEPDLTLYLSAKSPTISSPVHHPQWQPSSKLPPMLWAAFISDAHNVPGPVCLFLTPVAFVEGTVSLAFPGVAPCSSVFVHCLSCRCYMLCSCFLRCNSCAGPALSSLFIYCTSGPVSSGLSCVLSPRVIPVNQRVCSPMHCLHVVLSHSPVWFKSSNILVVLLQPTVLMSAPKRNKMPGGSASPPVPASSSARSSSGAN